MSRLPAALLGLTLAASLFTPASALAAGGDPAPASAHARTGLPSKAQWLADVGVALHGANRYLDARAAKADPRTLAIVLDIDNTSIQTHYDWARPVYRTRRVAAHAAALGMHVFFVTGRFKRDLAMIDPVLRKGGFRYDKVFGRRAGEGLVHEKSRHRTRITRALGLTIVADIGNNTSDLTGPYTGRTYKLPDYGGRLA
ncbi:MAG: HAD family acid phosphatase [Nocardioides sp.]|jgi:type IV secretory pathway TrbD component